MHGFRGKDEALDPHKASEPGARSLSPPASDGHSARDPEIERLLGNVEALVERDNGAVGKLRGLPTPGRWAIAATVVTALVGVVFALLRRENLEAVPTWYLALLAVSYIVPLTLLVGKVLAPLHRVESLPERSDLVLVAAFVLPFLWALLPPGALSHTAHTVAIKRDCLALGIALGALTIVALRALDRAADTEPRTVPMVAAAGGLVANLALVLHCPQTRLLHLVLVHAPIGLVLLFLYRRALSFRAARATGNAR